MHFQFQPSYDTAMSGPRAKIPWIEYNDIVMSDSQHIIDFLNKKFNIELNKHLSPKERATAWAVQKWLEEFTYWYEFIKRDIKGVICLHFCYRLHNIQLKPLSASP